MALNAGRLAVVQPKTLYCDFLAQKVNFSFIMYINLDYLTRSSIMEIKKKERFGRCNNKNFKRGEIY